MDRPRGQIRAIIFDLYNTLIFEPDFEDLFPTLAGLIGVSLADYTRHRQRTVEDAMVGRMATGEDRVRAILDGLGRPDADGLAARLAETERVGRWARVRVYPSTVSTLRRLRARGFSIGLVSDCTSLMGRRILEEHDLVSLFDAMALSYEVGHAKPSRHIYETVTTALNVKPSECLYVGDGGSDEIDGARALGMTTVRIDQEGAEARKRHPIDADDVIVQLAELLDLPILDPSSPGHPPLDVSWIARDLAVGGRIHPANLPRLKAMGIDSIVDLRAEESDDPELLAAHGLRFLHLPMIDANPLTQDQMGEGSRWVADERDAGRKVLVHCMHGVGRSVMLVAAVLIDGGMPVTAALDHLKIRRPRLALGAEQLAAVYHYGRIRQRHPDRRDFRRARDAIKLP